MILEIVRRTGVTVETSLPSPKKEKEAIPTRVHDSACSPDKSSRKITFILLLKLHSEDDGTEWGSGTLHKSFL